MTNWTNRAFNRTIAAAIASFAVASPLLGQEAPATPAPSPAPRSVPKIAFDPPTLDLGKISDDKNVSGTLTIRNDGDADLTISGVSSSCACTIPVLGGKKMDTQNKEASKASVTLKPGESTSLEVEYHPAGKRDKQSQKVTIKSNDPARREAVVELVAMVQPILRVDPAMISFGDLARGDVKTVIATVTGRTPDFAVPLVTTGNDAITARILDTVDVEEEGLKLRQVRVEFTLTASRPTTIAGIAAIRTTDPRRRLISVPITGAVLGDLALDKQKLALKPSAPGSAVEQTIRLSSRVGKPFKVLAVEDKAAGAAAPAWELVPAGEDAPGATDLKLAFTAPDKPGSWKGTLVITTDVPDQEKIEVPYFGSIRSTNPPPQPQPESAPR
jgi:hypothetical protein